MRRGSYKPDDDHEPVNVAVKMVPVDDPGAQAALQRELSILTELRHPCIVHLFGTALNEDEDELWAVLQFCELGSLGDILKRCSGEGASGGDAVLANLLDNLPGIGPMFFKLAKDIVRAVEYLHTQGIVHSDLKPANVLITGDGRALVADFGVARVVRTTAGGGRSTAGGGGPRGTAG